MYPEMCNIEYLSFKQVAPKDLMVVVNEDSLRTHLIKHPRFNTESIQAWIEEKNEVDTAPGCRVRVVSVGGVLAGWCGIQPDDSGFELAIVLSQRFWGSGRAIFKTLMLWASELGHKEVRFHLLDTRREYKALARMATKVYRSQLLGRNFITYHLSVGQHNAQ